MAVFSIVQCRLFIYGGFGVCGCVASSTVGGELIVEHLVPSETMVPFNGKIDRKDKGKAYCKVSKQIWGRVVTGSYASDAMASES